METMSKPPFRDGRALVAGMVCIILGWGSATAPVFGSDPPPPKPVEFVDLDRYAGLWYEIALIPNRFQKQCAYGTTAKYTLRKDGRLDVVNRCFEDDGMVSEARGIAKLVDSKSNARLKVSFVSFLGIRPFWGDYWIIGLGDDYEYAVIGTPDRKYGWVLARAPDIGPEIREKVWEILRAQGYDPEEFQVTAHR